ncbi:MOSC domain-containing protein [Rhodobacterales bacterium HKCCE3408]|nr:MOSC domain-containing protein [Rhodobacterales bacterium HKCCE3408]
MSATLAQIWRHPIKGVGAEPLDRVDLTKDRPLPLDRAWAVLQEGGEAGAGWRHSRNFVRGAKGPSLMAVTAKVETVSEPLGPDDATIPATRIRLSHPDRPEIVIDPARDGAQLVDWLKPIYPENRPAPADLIRAPLTGMADMEFPSVAILNLASLRALGQKIGQEMDPRRFRGNLWLDGLAPWDEFDLVGRTLRIGGAALEVVERITRCRATDANPETGHRDAAVLDTLEDGWGHTDFGVYARVTEGGRIAAGDTVTVQ